MNVVTEEKYLPWALLAPTLIIIGEVVRLRERLKWFEPAA